MDAHEVSGVARPKYDDADCSAYPPNVGGPFVGPPQSNHPQRLPPFGVVLAKKARLFYSVGHISLHKNNRSHIDAGMFNN